MYSDCFVTTVECYTLKISVYLFIFPFFSSGGLKITTIPFLSTEHINFTLTIHLNVLLIM